MPCMCKKFVIFREGFRVIWFMLGLWRIGRSKSHCVLGLLSNIYRISYLCIRDKYVIYSQLKDIPQSHHNCKNIDKNSKLMA